MFDSSRSRSRSRGSVPLALSLALNLFLIGWEVTQHLRAADFSKPDPAPEVVAESIASALPRTDGDTLRQAVLGQREPLRQARQRYLAAFDRLRRILSADPLDQAAFHDAIDELRASRGAERKLFGDTMVDVISRMSPEGRRAFVETHMGGRS